MDLQAKKLMMILDQHFYEDKQIPVSENNLFLTSSFQERFAITHNLI